MTLIEWWKQRGRKPDAVSVEQSERHHEVDDTTAPEIAAKEVFIKDRESIAGDRGIASVNRSHALQQRVTNVMAMTLMGALGLGLLTWYYSRLMAAPATAQHAAQTASRTRAQGDMPLPALGAVTPPVVEKTTLASTVLGEAPPLPENTSSLASLQRSSTVPTSSPSSMTSNSRDPAQEVQARRLSGPAFTAVNADTAAGAAMMVSSGAMPGTTNTPATQQSGGAMSSLLQPTTTPAVRAQVLPTQQLLLPKGAFIDCTLETAIDSSLPGLTTCITATDTFSADGTVVLLERGTKLVGETRGDVQQGMARLFVLWTEARTPTGVVVPLASPGTDELGRSGLPGEVNRHFMDRFGAAILISVIDGAIQAAVQSQRSNGTVVINPSSSRDILTEVLKSTLNIPPTITKQNGDRIQILVARDLDFRSVYELRADHAGR